MPLPEDVPLHENPWFRVFCREGYYTLEPRQAQVAIVPALGEDLVMVRVTRPVLGLSLLEFPAGGAEGEETPLEAARRELAEETGLWIEDLARFQSLPRLSIAPDRMPAWPHLFQVELTDAEYESRGAFDAEIEEVCRLSPEQLQAAVLAGRILACLPLALLCRRFCRTLSSQESTHE